ncbi:aspartate--tRNA ligase [Candidatus Woesearchaeota archaeon]|nr:aspartate--tRNA ligase [Candidatus Woesearchaeota archaeon]
MLRTHTCGELRGSDAGKTVTLCGWVDSQRIQGKLSFIILRDRYGSTQVFVNPALTKEFGEIRRESVIRVVGEVKKRPENQVRKELATGEVELSAKEIEILNAADALPLELDEKVESSEDVRLKYRFLDLRKKRLQKNLMLRSKVCIAIRKFLDKEGFIDLETPVLGKSTPEGARDYLVPSRVSKKQFYALPQSPQIFKQLFMVAGYDKYYQIAKCFRDEDLRADRQPEFTQLDMEMSFIEQQDIQDVIERLLQFVWKEVLNVDVKIPFQKLTYKEAIEKYKSDKPDIRKDKNDPQEYAFEWVVDFPLLEWNDDDKRYYAMHHPFTSPKKEDIALMEAKDEKEKAGIRANAYDIVLNGTELGGGSIRIHKRELQDKMFRCLGIDEAEADKKFGFLLNAFTFGAPPHGGIALGLDRMIMLMAGEKSIKEVIAYPKNKDARDLMLDAPSDVHTMQMDELGLKIKDK